LSVARVINPKHWTPRRVVEELQHIDRDPAICARAQRAADQIRREAAVETVVKLAVETLSRILR
jgi:UDP:flavonoid glycosyltransferase YjiC (YdhE family)